MKSKKNQFCLTKLLEYAASIDLIWLVIWGTIFVSFVVLDSIFQSAYPGRDVFYDFGNFRVQVVGNGTFIGVTMLKYIGIVLSFIYAKRKFPKDHVLQIALGFTLLADTILTFDQVSKLGVLAFCFAQYFHIARFAKIKPKYFIMWTLFMFLLLISGRIMKIESMFVLAFIYAISLSMNIILTRQWWKRVKNKKEASDREVVASTCAMAGFILFAMCDTNVALSYLSVTGAIPFFIARYATFFAWMFYYPSQVLISNSSVITEVRSKNPKNISTHK